MTLKFINVRHSLTCTHAHTHTYTHSHTHTYTHAHLHTYTPRIGFLIGAERKKKTYIFNLRTCLQLVNLQIKKGRISPPISFHNPLADTLIKQVNFQWRNAFVFSRRSFHHPRSKWGGQLSRATIKNSIDYPLRNLFVFIVLLLLLI